jgi:hypothetical protein
VLVREPDPVAGNPAHIRGAREEAAAGSGSDPGSEEALRGDEEAGLLIDLADGAPLEALARSKSSCGWLPGAGRALEEEHPSIRTDRQDAGDEVRLHSSPGATLLTFVFMRRSIVHGPCRTSPKKLGGFDD